MSDYPMGGYRLAQSPTPGQDRAARVVMGAIGLAFVLAMIGLFCFGCASGTVTTSTGAVVPASTVESQDNAYDFYLLVQRAHAAAVVQYEATKAVMDPTVRKSTYTSLNTMADGIDATRVALQTWKRTSASGMTPAVALKGILDAAPAFLSLGGRAGIVSQKDADAINAILAGFPRPVGMLTFRMEAFA
jgi:hypothetical protein